jgi:hypothetical protein
VKQARAQLGTALEATGPQSDVVAAEQVVTGLDDLEGSEDEGSEDEGSDDEGSKGLDDSDDLETPEVSEPGALVWLTLHEVVGLASTQPQRASTELMTWMAAAMPQPSITQPCAAPWMTADEAHWHSKSSVSQPAAVTAAEKMQDSAQSGTASALAWQGDTASHDGTGPEEEVVMGPVEDVTEGGGGSEVAGEDVFEDGGSVGALVSEGWAEDEVGSGSGSADVVVMEVGSGSGAAVATQLQTECPALMAPTMSVGRPEHRESTHGSAVREMAADEAGVQRHPGSVVSVQPISEPAEMMQEKAHSGNRVVRLRQAC